MTLPGHFLSCMCINGVLAVDGKLQNIPKGIVRHQPRVIPGWLRALTEQQNSELCVGARNL